MRAHHWATLFLAAATVTGAACSDSSNDNSAATSNGGTGGMTAGTGGSAGGNRDAGGTGGAGATGGKGGAGATGGTGASAGTGGSAGLAAGTGGAGGASGTGGASGAAGAGANDASADSNEAGGTGGSGGTGGAGGSAGTEAGAITSLQATQANGDYFPQGAVWYTDVSDANQFPKASDSDAITAWMVAHSGPDGWGGTGKFQIDLSIAAIEVPAGTMKSAFQTGDTSFHSDPDCDSVTVPVPLGGIVEGASGTASDFAGNRTGYACGGFDSGEDCHMLFVARSENRLYELYHSTINASGFFAGCLALWDTSKVYDKHGRGDQCTSADAAGFPIAPLLFTAEEVQAGSINHAIRFAIPNDMSRTKVYVPPATHGTNTTGPDTSFPYGAHLRLKTPYAGMDSLSPAAQVVARALQKYGMYHADGGQIPLMGQNDAISSVKWADVGLDSHSMFGIKATDFDVLAYDTPIPVTDNCQRTAITQ